MHLTVVSDTCTVLVTKSKMQPNALMFSSGHHKPGAPPLVILEGFLGAAVASLWGKFEEYLNDSSSGIPRQVIFASVGPVSSLHDRACELFYALKGGTVDYGQEHASQYRHGRWGKDIFPGLYPEWSKDKPLHFLGHSIGGPTITKLQWLISTGFFGPEYHPDMVQSITTVSAPFRGTQLVYTLGERTDAAPAVRPFSAGWCLLKFVHIIAYLTPFLPAVLDLHVHSRRLAYPHASLPSLLSQLHRSDWGEGEDAAPYDVTFRATDEREYGQGEGKVNRNTYYRSYSACILPSTDLASGPGMNRPKDTNQAWKRSTWQSIINIDHIVSAILSLFVALTFRLTSRIMATFDFTTIHPMPSWLCSTTSASTCTSTSSTGTVLPFPSSPANDTRSRPQKEDEIPEWATRANDGAVPLFSQWHPLSCSVTACHHYCYPEEELCQEVSEKGESLPEDKIQRYAGQACLPKPGVWHVYHLQNARHLSLIPKWYGDQRQLTFWRDIGQWLRAIDIDSHPAARIEKFP